jgi:hypothetical protein
MALTLATAVFCQCMTDPLDDKVLTGQLLVSDGPAIQSSQGVQGGGSAIDQTRHDGTRYSGEDARLSQ